MQTFDACLNDELGGVVEVAIMLTVDDFYDHVKRRYLSCMDSCGERAVVGRR
jgi:hypothetical protein